jgi:hypothetical protein
LPPNSHTKKKKKRKETKPLQNDPRSPFYDSFNSQEEAGIGLMVLILKYCPGILPSISVF